MMPIHCLMSSGRPLSDHGAEALLQTAIRMMDKDKRRMRVVHDDVYGAVTTEFEHVVMGTFGGYVFEADVEDDNGTHTVKFLVNADKEALRQEGKWVKTGFN